MSADSSVPRSTERLIARVTPAETCERAHELGCEIEALLALVGQIEGGDGRSVRMAQALTRSLLDELGAILRRRAA